MDNPVRNHTADVRTKRSLSEEGRQDEASHEEDEADDQEVVARFAAREQPAYDAFMASRANRPNIGPYSLLLHMPETAQRLEALRTLRDGARPFVVHLYDAYTEPTDGDALPDWLAQIGRMLPLTHGIAAAREIAAGASL